MEALKITEETVWENAFEHRKKKAGLNLNPALSTNRPSNNWAVDTNLPLSELGVKPAWLDDSEDKDDADEETVKNESVEDEVDNEEIFEDELDEEVDESSVSPLAWPSFFIVAMTSQPEASLNWT